MKPMVRTQDLKLEVTWIFLPILCSTPQLRFQIGNWISSYQAFLEFVFFITIG